MRFRSSLIAAAVVSCLGASAFAANPAYDSWASHKPGTSVTMTSNTEMPSMKTSSELTYTLKDVTPAKVTIEIKTTTTMMGNKVESPATTMDIPADAPAAPAAPNAPAAGADSKTSQEKVTVAGKEYDATATTTKSEANGMKTTATVWTSKDVPGMTLKMESTSDGQMKMTTKMEVTKIDLK